MIPCSGDYVCIQVPLFLFLGPPELMWTVINYAIVYSADVLSEKKNIVTVKTL